MRRIFLFLLLMFSFSFAYYNTTFLRYNEYNISSNYSYSDYSVVINVTLNKTIDPSANGSAIRVTWVNYSDSSEHTAGYCREQGTYVTGRNGWDATNGLGFVWAAINVTPNQTAVRVYYYNQSVVDDTSNCSNAFPLGFDDVTTSAQFHLTAATATATTDGMNFTRAGASINVYTNSSVLYKRAIARVRAITVIWNSYGSNYFAIGNSQTGPVMTILNVGGSNNSIFNLGIYNSTWSTTNAYNLSAEQAGTREWATYELNWYNQTENVTGSVNHNTSMISKSMYHPMTVQQPLGFYIQAIGGDDAKAIEVDWYANATPHLTLDTPSSLFVNENEYVPAINVSFAALTPPDGAYINGTLFVNATINGTTNCNLTLNTTKYTMTVSADYLHCYLNSTLADGNYSYSVTSWNSSFAGVAHTETRTVVIDTTIPSGINLTNTNNTYFYQNTSFIFVFSETNVKYCNISINGTIYPATNLANKTCNYSFLNQHGGNYTVYAIVTDQINATINSLTYSYYGFNVTGVAYTFSAPQTDLLRDNMAINLTLFNFFDSSNGTLNYSLANYVTNTTLTGNNLYVNGSIVPPVTAGSAVNFTFFVTFNTTVLLSYSNNTTINSTLVTDCKIANGTVLYRFDFFDQEEPNVTNVTNSTMEATFQLYGTSGVLKNFSFNFSIPTPTILICINQTNGTFNVDSIQQYRATGYRNIYYYLLNSSVSVPIQNNISLYNLNQSISMITQYQVVDDAYLPIADAYLQILRYYPETNTLILVSMAKTNENGIATSYAIPNDVNYRYIVIKDYNVIFASNVATLPCDITSGVCSVTIQATSSAINEYSAYVGATGVGCGYNITALVVYCTNTDPSGTGSDLVLKVWQVGTYSNTLICTNSISTASGTVICNLPDATHAYIYSATSTVGSIKWIGGGEIGMDVTSIFGSTTTGKWIATFAAILMIAAFALLGLVGGFSASIVMAIFGMIIASLIGFLDIGLGAVAALSTIGLVLAWVLRN